jgi:phage-related protein
MKPIVFLGDSLERVREFPQRARRNCGYQLDRVQNGLEPDDWKPMASVGVGVREIRVRDASGAYRVIYVANWKDAVYVLHAFQKKSQRAPLRDLAVAKTRLSELKRGTAE